MQRLDISSWPLLFNLYRKGQIHNINLVVAGRVMKAEDVMVPYSGKRISEMMPDELPEELGPILLNFCIEPLNDHDQREKIVVPYPSPDVQFYWKVL